MADEETIEVNIKQAGWDHEDDDGWIVEVADTNDGNDLENRIAIYGYQLDELITKLQRAKRLISAFDYAITMDEQVEVRNRDNRPEPTGKPYR